jgi:hypothetical protein
MAKYRIYAGLSGRFGGMVYQGIYDCKSQEEANWKAYDIAVEEYESYGGSHGLLDIDDCYEDLLESGWIDPGHQPDSEIHRLVEDAYREQVEMWIEYKAVLCAEDPADDDWKSPDDDADCFCDD